MKRSHLVSLLKDMCLIKSEPELPVLRLSVPGSRVRELLHLSDQNIRANNEDRYLTLAKWELWECVYDIFPDVETKLHYYTIDFPAPGKVDLLIYKED